MNFYCLEGDTVLKKWLVTVFAKIQSGLTRLYARKRGGITDISEYSASEVTQTVYWFRNDSKRMGDYSPLGTILLNERLRDDYSEDVVDYVFLHEVGHAQMGIIGRTSFWAAYLVSGLLFITGVISLPNTLLEAVQTSPSSSMLPVYIAVTLGITVAAAVPFTLVCWLDEALAELFAISKIGISRYQSVKQEIEKESEGGLLRKIRIRIQYPPDSLILWVAQIRGIGER